MSEPDNGEHRQKQGRRCRILEAVTKVLNAGASLRRRLDMRMALLKDHPSLPSALLTTVHCRDVVFQRLPIWGTKLHTICMHLAASGSLRCG